MDDIFLSAYGAKNLGDDLFIKILCERYPNKRFVFFASKAYKKYGIKNLKVRFFYMKPEKSLLPPSLTTKEVSLKSI